MQKVRSRLAAPTVRRHTGSGSFHSLLRVLFTFPSRYLFTIGHQVVFSLGRWSSQIPAGLHVSCGTRVPARGSRRFIYRAVTVFGRPFHAVRLSQLADVAGPTTPEDFRPRVWAVPRSLAATGGISIDVFSCRYLDVSVPCVRASHWLVKPVGCPIRTSPGQMLTYS